jgi:hypothetical protein
VLRINDTGGISLSIKRGTAKIMTEKAATSSSLLYVAIVKIIERWYLDF